MNSNKCEFLSNVTDLALFCATLTREGIAFHVRVRTDGTVSEYTVEITGY